MTFQQSIRTCLQTYATFQGRARRSEFWWFVLFVFLVSAAADILDGVIFGSPSSGEAGISIFAPIVGLALFLPTLAVAVRRLHDIGRSGWWVFLNLVPIVGFLVLLYWYTRDSEPETNVYGPPPKALVPV